MGTGTGQVPFSANPTEDSEACVGMMRCWRIDDSRTGVS